MDRRRTADQPYQAGPLHTYLAQDHDRLAAWLARTLDSPPGLDQGAYAHFRAGLLRHIGLEEKLLLPLVRRGGGSELALLADQLHRDHAALTALLVPPPAPELIHTIRSILEEHNVLEEESGGLYEACERLAAGNAQTLATQLQAARAVPVRPHIDTALVRKNIEVLLTARKRAVAESEGG
jgi:hypothetical protein